jgi:alpha-tubulin suppressor-like RCC1 family protein
LFCWGGDHSGQIGLDPNAPDGDKLVIAQPSAVGSGNWLAVAAGTYHNCGRKRMQLYCWGSGNHGELGGAPVAIASTPTAVSTPSNLRRLALGNDFSCGFDSGDQLYCWGDNDHGELGVGDTELHGQLVSVSF